MKEIIVKAWASHHDIHNMDGSPDSRGHVRYAVMYHTDVGLENMFITYEGRPSDRNWNLTKQIADGSLWNRNSTTDEA